MDGFGSRLSYQGGIMSLRINTNVDALSAYRNLNNTQSALSTSLERLSSGLRINRAADDAAGLAISEGLKAQIGGIGVAMRNAQEGINVVQTADGALTETHAILQRMRDLAVQASNDSNDDQSRQSIQKEVTALQAELDRIADKTTFNNVKLLNGSFTGKEFHVGYASGDTITVGIAGGFSAETLGVAALKTQPDPNFVPEDLTDVADLITSGVDYTTQAYAEAAITAVDAAIQTVSAARADLGALQNRFQHTINNLSVTQQNLQASASGILDTDMAAEMTAFTRSQILSQAGTSMLAQANMAPQSILKLLG
jgi:flagellin